MLQTRVMIVDGNNVYARAWFTINGAKQAGNTNKANKESLKKTVSLFKNMVVNLRKNFLSELVIICWDGGKDAERLSLSPSYKQREEKPSGYYEGISVLQKEIEQACAQYVQIQITGAEADDIIGTLAHYYSLLDCIVIIASDDKDMLQLINENVIISHSKKGTIDRLKFEETFGFEPVLFVDYLAILGDEIDNVPGIKGIGKVGAQELVQKFGTVETIYGNIAAVPPKYVEKLKQSQEDAMLSKKLIVLKTINIPTHKLVEPCVNKAIVVEDFAL